MFRLSHSRSWPFRLHLDSKKRYLLFLLLLLVMPGILPVSASTTTSTASISVNGTSATGKLLTQLSTNDVWSGMVTQAPGGQTKLNAYHPPLVRIHAGTDGWPGALPQFFLGLLDIIGEPHQITGPPEYGKHAQDHRGPDYNWQIFFHCFVLLAEGEGFEPPMAVTP